MFGKLRPLLPFLRKTIELIFGLLEELISRDVLSDEEVDEIRSELSLFKKNQKLLQCITCDEKLELLFECLNENKQPHVANYIKFDGSYANEVGECWPLDEESIQKFKKNLRKLTIWLDTDTDLINHMKSKECLIHDQLRVIEALSERTEKNKKLLEFLGRRGIIHFRLFTACLEELQPHLVSFFTGDDAGSDDPKMQPVDDIQLQRIRTNAVYLGEKIELRYGLIDELLSKRCITDMQKTAMERAVDPVSKLLDVMSCKSAFVFKTFLDVLDTCRQPHVVKMLTSGAVAPSVRAELNLECEPTENKIVSKLMGVIETVKGIKEVDEPEKLADSLIFDTILNLLRELGINDIRDCHFGEGSILSFFVCDSREKLLELRGHFESGFMKKVLGRIFSVVADEPIVINQLIWNVADYNYQLSMFHESSTSMEGEDAECSDVDDEEDITAENESEMGSDYIDMGEIRRPVERDHRDVILANWEKLTEIIRVDVHLLRKLELSSVITHLESMTVAKQVPQHKIAEALLKVMRLKSSDKCVRFLRCLRSNVADPSLLRKLLAVNKVTGKLLFSLTRPPFYIIEVAGVTIVGKNIYVVYVGYENIVKYDENDLTLTDVIKVTGMRLPMDIVADIVRGMLFVCDYDSGVIWRVSIDKREIKEFAGFTRPWSLDLVDTRLLVTSLDSLAMLNSLSGDVIMEITFPFDEERGDICHSIESERETLFVGFEKAVIEIDFTGSVLRVFNCGEQLLTSYHLALDSVGHRLFVADNSRIFVLNEELKFQTLLIDSKQLDNELPLTLSYDGKKRSLAVGLRNGHVKIFEIFER